MNKEERMLREQISEAQEEIRSLMAEDNLDEAEEKTDELEKLQRKLKVVRAAGQELPAVKKTEDKSDGEERGVGELTKDELADEYTQTFLRAIRGKELNQRDLEVYGRVVREKDYPKGADGEVVVPYASSTDENGAILVPQELSRKIEEYKRQMEYDLTQIVSVERVSTLAGQRPFASLSDAQPWTPIEEWDIIPEHEVPEFELKSYAVKSYAGIIPIPRTMLQDSDQNLMNYLARYIARKSIVTRNARILAVLDETYATKEAVTGLADLKTIFNVTLDPAFSESASIITNQDGFNALDQLTYEDGRSILQDDETVATGKSVKGHQVVVLPNRTLKSSGSGAPLYVGQLSEAVIFFDRGVYEVESTTIGGDSFKRNTVDTRVIDRFDVQAWDSEAVVAAEISVTPEPAA